MKTNFKTLLIAFIAVSGLHLISSNCVAQEKMENQLLNLFQKTDLEKNVLVINSLQDNKVQYTTEKGWKPGQDDAQRRGGDIVCQGEGYDFVKCVQAYVIKGGRCLVYKYKNGNLYVAHSLL